MKCILHYLKDCVDVGLLIDKGSSLTVHSYVDVDFVGGLDNKKIHKWLCLCWAANL